MGLDVLQRAKHCLTQKPPAVIFLLCLSAIGIAFTSLSFYVRNVQLRNPDIEIDWNVILGNMAKVDYCATDLDQLQPTAAAKTSLMPKLNKNSSAFVTTASPSSRNYSIAMLVTLTPITKASAPARNLTYVFGSLIGKQLGLHGDLEEEQINVTFQVPHETCGAAFCQPRPVVTCVHLQANEGVFPLARQPTECKPLNDSLSPLTTQLSGSLGSLAARLSCKGTKIRLQHATDAALTVMLSLHDRSMASLHLLHTSYFVFIMAVTILFFSVLRSRRSQYSSAQLQQA